MAVKSNILFFQKSQNKFLILFRTMLLVTVLIFSQVSNTAWSQKDGQDEAWSEASANIEAPSDTLGAFETNPKLATIYVIREKKYLGALIKIKIYFNYHYMGKIGNGRYAVFLVPPGEYLLGVLENKAKRSITLNVEAGNIYYSKLGTQLGTIKARGVFTYTQENEARALIPKLHKSKDKYVEKYPTK